MTNINDLLNNLFNGKGSNFTHKENFTQSLAEEQRVREWISSSEGKALFDQIFKAYGLEKAGLPDHLELHVLNSPYANGFALTYSPSMTEKTFSDLFFAFGLRMLDLGYYRVSLDRTMRETAGLIKTAEKQYFKPSVPKIDAQKTEQLYGNVSIEKDLVNNRPSFLKILVTVYSGYHYRDARPFDQFMEDLFKA